jgi:hypothetical protein
MTSPPAVDPDTTSQSDTGTTRSRVRVRVAGVDRTGRALDLAGVDVAPRTLAAAARDGDDDRVHCPSAGPVHEHVGLVDGRPVARRRVLAAVARALGHRAPNRDRIDDLTERLAALDPSTVDLAAARERVATAGDDVDRLRERVAALRGRVEALREAGTDPSDAAADLAAAAGALSEAETERAAARQALDRERERARAARDARERRLELEDNLGNARREARAALACRVRERVDAAAVAAPGARATGFAAAAPVTARLALARVAPLAAPVVLAVRRFPDTGAASDWLGAPVVRV